MGVRYGESVLCIAAFLFDPDIRIDGKVLYAYKHMRGKFHSGEKMETAVPVEQKATL